jgi:serine/threonine-protein kinase
MPILTAEERLGTALVGRYRLDTVLGTGGMGILFIALDTSSGMRVAVKMLKPEHSANRDRVARFVRETKIAGTLRHPNVAAVLDSGIEETGAPYLVMELLNGRSFEDELSERGTIPYEQALAVVLPIARALSVAHARGVIHRDLKPSNIFLCRDADGSVVPKLLDFGIAKSDANDFETQTGLVVGSPSYMAPEQARDGECGVYTDIWGIAAVLYRAVTGKPPHAADSVHEMLAQRVREPASPLVAPGVKKSVCAVVDRALERDPERRHRTMQAFIDALEGASASDGESSHEETQELCAGKLEITLAASEPTPALGGDLSEPSSPRSRVRPAAFAAATAVMLLLVVVQFIRHAEGVATKQQALVRQDPTATIDRNPASLPIMPIRKQVESRLDVSDDVSHPAPQSAIAPAPPPAPVRNEAAWSDVPSPGVAHRDGPRTLPARIPEATTSPQNPRPQDVDSAKTVSPPEYERRTGLPLATEW